LAKDIVAFTRAKNASPLVAHLAYLILAAVTRQVHPHIEIDDLHFHESPEDQAKCDAPGVTLDVEDIAKKMVH
jgi:hypothetical protein